MHTINLLPHYTDTDYLPLSAMSPSLPILLLKCQLLTYCYGEVFEEDLAQEAHQIMDSWKNRALSEEELEVMETLQTMEDNRYPCSEVED